MNQLDYTSLEWQERAIGRFVLARIAQEHGFLDALSREEPKRLPLNRELNRLMQLKADAFVFAIQKDPQP